MLIINWSSFLVLELMPLAEEVSFSKEGGVYIGSSNHSEFCTEEGEENIFIGSPELTKRKFRVWSVAYVHDFGFQIVSSLIVRLTPYDNSNGITTTNIGMSCSSDGEK